MVALFASARAKKKKNATIKTKNSTLAIPALAPAVFEKPKNEATIATIRKNNAHFNMIGDFKFLFTFSNCRKYMAV